MFKHKLNKPPLKLVCSVVCSKRPPPPPKKEKVYFDKNAPSQINAPGPQTLFYKFRSCFGKRPLSINIFYFFFLEGGGGAFIGTTTEFGKSVLGPGAVYCEGAFIK